MQASDLRDRVGFYRRIEVDDGYGNTEAGFPADPEFIVSANIKPRLGGEQVLAARLQGTHLANITVRYSDASASVTTDWRARDEHTGEVYNIRSIIDPAQDKSRRKMFIEMLCEKGVAT